MSKSKPFYIELSGNNPHKNCLAEIGEWLKDGALKVTLSRTKMTRKQSQNRVMHMWFKDIHNQTAEPLYEIGGRCKLQYFLPVLLASDTDEAQRFQDLWETISAVKNYDKQIEILGKSDLASTSNMTTKEFSHALNAMRLGECRSHYLTDPATHGLRF